MTFSIVGFDAQSGDLGIAVASKFLAVGAVVPWAVAGVGPIDGQWNQDSQAALRAWAGVENLEERVLEHGIDPIVLRHLREQHAR